MAGGGEGFDEPVQGEGRRWRIKEGREGRTEPCSEELPGCMVAGLNGLNRLNE
jgi:hypothetical protein